MIRRAFFIQAGSHFTAEATRFRRNLCSLTRVYLGVQSSRLTGGPLCAAAHFCITPLAASLPPPLVLMPSPNASLHFHRSRKNSLPPTKSRSAAPASRLHVLPWARAQSASPIIRTR